MTRPDLVPDWCSAETMAGLLDLAPSTFRQYVADGVLPQGRRIGSKVRWSRHQVNAVLSGSDVGEGSPASSSLPPKGDPIMEAARGGKAKSARRATA